MKSNLDEGDRGIGVLDSFTCGMSVILISNCGIGILRTRGMRFL